jgi:hypothetical protein
MMARLFCSLLLLIGNTVVDARAPRRLHLSFRVTF